MTEPKPIETLPLDDDSRVTEDCVCLHYDSSDALSSSAAYPRGVRISPGHRFTHWIPAPIRPRLRPPLGGRAHWCGEAVVEDDGTKIYVEGGLLAIDWEDESLVANPCNVLAVIAIAFPEEFAAAAKSLEKGSR